MEARGPSPGFATLSPSDGERESIASPVFSLAPLGERDGGEGDVAEEFQAVNAAVRALLLALEGLGFHQRHGPPLELVFVPRGEVARGVQVFGRAVDFKREAGLEGVPQPFLDERNGEVRDVYADPLAVELLRGVNRRAATAERKTAWLKIPSLTIAQPFMAGNKATNNSKSRQGRKNLNPTSPLWNHIHASSKKLPTPRENFSSGDVPPASGCNESCPPRPKRQC